MRRWLAYFCLSLFATILGLELMLAVLLYLGCFSPLPSGIRNERGTLSEQIELAPNFDGKSRSGVRYRTNSLGYRGTEPDPSKSYILFLGDSTTFGLNVSEQESYPAVATAELNRRRESGDYQYLNSATPGQGTINELHRLEFLLRRYDGKIKAIVLGFYANDFENNQRTQEAASLASPTLESIKHWLARSLVVRLAYSLIDSQIARIFSARLPENNGIAPAAIDLTKDSLHKIISLARVKEVPILLLYLPSSEEEILSGRTPAYWRNLVRDGYLRRASYEMSAIQIYSFWLLQNGYRDRLPSGFFSAPRDAGHPGPLASRLIGEAVARWLHDVVAANY